MHDYTLGLRSPIVSVLHPVLFQQPGWSLKQLVKSIKDEVEWHPRFTVVMTHRSAAALLNPKSKTYHYWQTKPSADNIPVFEHPFFRSEDVSMMLVLNKKRRNDNEVLVAIANAIDGDNIKKYIVCYHSLHAHITRVHNITSLKILINIANEPDPPGHYQPGSLVNTQCPFECFYGCKCGKNCLMCNPAKDTDDKEDDTKYITVGNEKKYVTLTITTVDKFMKILEAKNTENDGDNNQVEQPQVQSNNNNKNQNNNNNDNNNNNNNNNDMMDIE